MSRGSENEPIAFPWTSRMAANGGVLIDNPNEPKAQDIAVSDIESWIEDNPSAKVYQMV